MNGISARLPASRLGVSRGPADGVKRQARSRPAPIAFDLEPAQAAIDALAYRWGGLRRPDIAFHAQRPRMSPRHGWPHGRPSPPLPGRPARVTRRPPICPCTTFQLLWAPFLLNPQAAAACRGDARARCLRNGYEVTREHLRCLCTRLYRARSGGPKAGRQAGLRSLE